jgi:hypothetical protein
MKRDHVFSDSDSKCAEPLERNEEICSSPISVMIVENPITWPLKDGGKSEFLKPRNKAD